MSYIFDDPLEVSPAQAAVFADFADLMVYNTNTGRRIDPKLSASVSYMLYRGAPGRFIDIQRVNNKYTEPESLTLTEFVNQATSIEAGVFGYLESIGELPPGNIDPSTMRTNIFGTISLDGLTAAQIRDIRRFLRQQRVP